MRWTNRPTFQQLMSFSATVPMAGRRYRYARRVRKRYLMAPGPTPVPPEVLAAGAAPVIHHRGPDFRELMLRTLARLQQVCRTRERRAALHRVRLRRVRVGDREPALAGRARARRHGGRVRRSLVQRWRPPSARTSTSFGTPGGRRRSRRTSASRLEETGAESSIARALGDVDRGRRRRAGARAGRARGRRARRRGRRVEPRRGAARDRRVGPRRRRRRVAEGADDASGLSLATVSEAAWERAEALDDAALLLRLGAHASGARDAGRRPSRPR